jgi:phosphoribosyl 1,2-cyclic phosphodiesterase
MRVYVLGSGSNGNATVVEADDGSRVVLDAGLNGEQAARQMRLLGADLFPRGALGVVITHHHGDHICKAHPLSKALRAPLFMHAGIEASRLRRKLEVRSYKPQVPFSLGPFVIDALSIPHDAPQVALRVSAHGKTFGLATDLGHVTEELVAFLSDCDVVLVEANYCPRLLEVGPYPPNLRRRVGGPLGHLANEQTAALAARLAGSRVVTLLLGHLSLANNTPERALEVVRARARSLPVEVVPNGAPRVVDFAVALLGAGPRAQLALPFASVDGASFGENPDTRAADAHDLRLMC